MKKKINKQHVKLEIQVTNLLNTWDGDLQKLPANKIFELIIDYPLSTPAIYKIKTGKKGMGLAKLLKTIGKAYQKTYNRENVSIARLKDEDAKSLYGIWGHSIDDLSIEGITVDFKKKIITLDVGS